MQISVNVCGIARCLFVVCLFAVSGVQEVDVIFQRVLQEIEKQHGTQDDGGCVLL